MSSLARLTGCILLGGTMVAGSMSAARADADVPLGYWLMCLEHPQECEAGGASSVVVTADIAATIESINSTINRSITPMNDAGPDVWSIGVAAGDCEDYVLAKRHALIASGLPPSALRIAYVVTERQEGHAILVVKTDDKDLVLDNLSSVVRTVDESGYNIISMSGADPLVWS
jgi:predicted transglutaminase-like cysteine proteinase